MTYVDEQGDVVVQAGQSVDAITRGLLLHLQRQFADIEHDTDELHEVYDAIDIVLRYLEKPTSTP